MDLLVATLACTTRAITSTFDPAKLKTGGVLPVMESDDDVGRESNFLCACPQRTDLLIATLACTTRAITSTFDPAKLETGGVLPVMESDDDVGRESNFPCACPQRTEPNTLAIEDPQTAVSSGV
jgi:hypothetical protein